MRQTIGGTFSSPGSEEWWSSRNIINNQLQNSQNAKNVDSNNPCRKNGLPLAGNQLVHYDINLKQGLYRNQFPNSKGIGSASGCKVCEDTNNGPKLKYVYAISNLKGPTGIKYVLNSNNQMPSRLDQ